MIDRLLALEASHAELTARLAQVATAFTASSLGVVAMLRGSRKLRA